MMAQAHDRSGPAAWLRGIEVFGAIPGVPALLACLGLLLAWHLTAKLVALDSLPSPWVCIAGSAGEFSATARRC